MSESTMVLDENPDQKPIFKVKLEEFEGPFDLLLSLIAKHELEVTALALHLVTDDFLNFIKAQGDHWDLETTTEFLVIAATLLDLKAARLLPSGEVEDEEDIARLEARDLLFARLLQYKAFKEVSSWFRNEMDLNQKRVARLVSVEPAFANLLPEVLIGLGPNEFARLAKKVFEPKYEPELTLTHLHAPLVSVAEQSQIIVEKLRKSGTATFRSLVAGASVGEIVARFLAILDLFKQSQVVLEQAAPLADLFIRWSGSAEGEISVGHEFDEEETNE
ncbi:MAG: segregation and condensation protein A [Candidatus Nanopelagicales bacterium]